jgi:fused signal recognition particle receptor
VASLRDGLKRTRQSFFGRIAQAFGATDIDEDTWDDVEALLVQADVGVSTTMKLVETMQARVKREGIVKTGCSTR